MNLMDLFIKIGVKDDASGPIKKLTGAVGKGLVTAAKVGAAAVGAASTAIGALLMQSVKAYGEYEQLVGGAKKIFDEMNYSVIAADAADAWKTMNLSASDYLRMINSVGATFSATMGDEKGYETAKKGMQAIADYASGTGRDVNELNDKFALITRSAQSYQSIADQFSGILPATSKDFLEQAQAAGILSDQYKSLTEVPIDEYQQAVSAMLEKGVDDLGLAGNTAEETAKTITGSLAGLKASWQNLITGLGDSEADIGQLFDNLLENAMNFVNNVKPVVKTAVTSVAKLIRKLAPQIGKELPKLLKDLLPDVLSAAGELVDGLVSALPELIEVAIENLPELIATGVKIAQKVVTGILQAIPSALKQIWDQADKVISNSSFAERWESIKSTVGGVIDSLKEKFDTLKEAFQPLIEKVQTFWQKFKDWAGENKLLEKGIKLVGDAVGLVVDGVSWLVNGFNKALEIGKKVVDGLKEAWQGFLELVDDIASKVVSIFDVTAGAERRSADRTAALDSIDWNYAAAGGRDYVPYDNYPSLLHRGEAVLTAREADDWRRGKGSGRGIVNNFNFYGVSQSDLDYIVGYVNRSLA